ncbi:tRNA pseudouridine(55) synthase TruB [Pelagibacterium sp. H642]|uniref:tRNA pseudouridine(55) synthase TruB n=1 Tax=Pelagibacterium sp. H642 TaxID=1881069 RepID=UPI002815DE8B|nr:tRNA pseudouridine(55) synthase TruB [Pelagibacterium sp. H642]WMT92167.1 tRNA pseudouridine(55) synthase TruB [Pelagibacterium sp. H642]
MSEAPKKRVKRDLSGWLVFNKPYDMSSTEAVGKLRWLYGAKKAGHAGTLDPLATGILPIAFGEATKTVPAVQDGVKVYHFDIAWGAATTTDDIEGEVIATSDVRPTGEALAALLPRFTGIITQVPPAFSAIKIGGERAYDLARAGEKLDMPPREVEIDALEILSHGHDRSRLSVTCSKGTYVRALARDIAEALGTKGHVGALHRAQVGAFTDADAVTLEAIETADQAGRDDLLLPVAAGLAGLPEVRLDARQAATVRLGNPVLLTGREAPIALDDAWASLKGEAVALGVVEAGQFKPRRVILG